MTIEKSKELLRLEIIQHVSAYLKKGKKINKIPFGEQNEIIDRSAGGKSGRSGRENFGAKFASNRGKDFVERRKKR